MVRGAHATLRPMTTRRQSVILGTIGRTSGRPIDVPLYAAEDGDRLVIVGSNGGKPRDPSWVDNLRAQPDVTVRLGKQRREVRAREVAGEERERLWALAVEGFPMYASFARKAPRPIPVFALEPRA
jgi:deazaflavin-dependent oxidoreductase (nitroreductase family)